MLATAVNGGGDPSRKHALRQDHEGGDDEQEPKCRRDQEQDPGRNAHIVRRRG